MSSEAPSPPRRRVRLAAGALALTLLVLLSLAGWLLGTTSGARTVFSALTAASGGKLRIGVVEGRLLGPLHLEQANLQSTGMQTGLRDIHLDWRPRALLRGRLHVTSLRVGAIELKQRIGQPPAPDQPTALPANLALPLRLAIDSVQVGGGKLAWGALNVIELGAFKLHLDYDGARYRLGLEQLNASTGGAASSQAGAFRASLRGNAELADTAPYPLSGVFNSQTEAQIGQQRLSGAGAIRLDGSLAHLQTIMDFTMGAASINGRAVVQPFAEVLLDEAEIDVQMLDLAAFGAGLPRTAIGASLSADARGGTLALTNVEAGTYDAGRLPLRTLSASFRQDRQGFGFDGIAAALGSNAAPAGVIQGSGSLTKGALNLALTTAALDLKRLDRRLLSTRLAGKADVRHAAGRQEFILDLSEPLQNRRLALAARATLADEALALERLDLTLGNGRLRASGRLHLADMREFAASGAFSHFRLQDLGQFARWPELTLNGEFSLDGALAPQLTAALDFRIADSRLAGHLLRGEGRARLQADSLDVPKLTLAAGANRLEIAGRLQQEGGQVTFALDAPALAQFGPGFAGAAAAKGSVRGSFARPRIAAQWQASQLRLPELLQIDGASGNAELEIDRKAPWMLGHASIDTAAQGIKSGAMQIADASAMLRFAPPAGAPLALQVRAQNIAAGNYRADSLHVEGSGSTGRHTLTATLAEPGQQWHLQAEGGLQAQAQRWQGSIAQLSASGRLQAGLAAPAPLEITRRHIELRQFRLEADGALFAIDQLRRDEQGIRTRGRFDRLALATLLPYVQPQANFSTDLQLVGEWDLALNRAGAPRGTFSLRRERGDLAVHGATPVTLGLSRLEAIARAGDDKLQLLLHAEGARLGNIAVDAGLSLDGSSRFGISPRSALSGGARLAIPSLRWVGPLIDSTAIAEGSLNGELRLAGNLAAPQLAGQIKGQGLRLALPDLGTDLRGGTLDASFQDHRLIVQSLAFAQGDGQLTIAGPIDLGAAQPDVQLKIEARRYPLLTRSDRKLVISGNGAVGLREGRLQISGGLSADSGMIDVGHANKPSLSDDVVIVGKSSRKTVTPLALDLVIGLGEGIVVRGHGLDAVLVGQLQFKNDAGEALKAQGAMRVVRGTFAAYGRELEIEKGLLFFNGSPGNPGLDILAMRRGQPVEAGVAVLGTALAPRIVLVSEPAVADAEKLSWLVLGRGLNAATGGGDLAALQGAAAALLGQGAAAGAQAGLAGALGLDELSLGTSSDNLQQRIVTVGKQVSSRLHIGIERGLETASSVLLLRYTISRKLSLEIDTGSRTAFTLFYNFVFD